MGDALPDGPLGGLLAVTVYSLVLVASFGALLYMYEIAGKLERLADRVLPRPTLPVHPPIEQVARDARRVHADLLTLTPGTPMARRRGISQAYDDLLAIACRELNVQDTLTGLPPGTERDAQRRRVVRELEAAGLQLNG